MPKTPKLILVHDYLIQMGGAERVVASMSRQFPQAPIYTSASDLKNAAPEFKKADVKTTWMQSLPGMPARFKHYFPLYPAAFRSFGKVSCEVAWVSASTFAKCLRVENTAATVCYCHAPTRFLWRTDEYMDGEVQNSAVIRMLKLMFPWLRAVDKAAARRMDFIIANSENVRERIRGCYHCEARVVHPPVEVDRFSVSDQPLRTRYLLASRLVGYKRIDRAVEAFNQLGRPLTIVGDGPDRARLEQLAGSNITFTGRVQDSELTALLRESCAFVFPGEEDFGITPVEAQACGVPVIAWGRGGALETVRDGETGVFFWQGTPEALMDAVKRADGIEWDRSRIRNWAEGFSEVAFLKNMEKIIEEARELHRYRKSSIR